MSSDDRLTDLTLKKNELLLDSPFPDLITPSPIKQGLRLPNQANLSY